MFENINNIALMNHFISAVFTLQHSNDIIIDETISEIFKQLREELEKRELVTFH